MLGCTPSTDRSLPWHHRAIHVDYAAANGAPLLLPGNVLVEKYRVLRLIGRGGMAEVYAAHHELLHQTVALKLLLPELVSVPQAPARFLNEARAAARIRGENIATVMDVGMLEDGTPFIVLEYLEGRDLEAYAVERGPLPAAEAVDYVLQALQALAQAHALGIVHRDVKPSNLFLAQHPDGSNVLKVLDFGISKASPVMGQIVDGNSTSTHMMLGSPLYMAPEQARNAKAVDPRADIWAIGVVLYRLLVGRVPFTGASLAELLMVIAQDEPTSVRDARPELPGGLEEAIERCLRKRPYERFPSVAELAMTLQPFGGPDAARRVERICRTLAGKPASVSTPQAMAGSPHQSSGTLLAGSGVWGEWTESVEAKPAEWAESKRGGRDPSQSRARLLGFSAAGIIAVAVAVGGALAVRLKPPAAVEREPPAAIGADNAHAPPVLSADDLRNPSAAPGLAAMPSGTRPPRAVALPSAIGLPDLAASSSSAHLSAAAPSSSTAQLRAAAALSGREPLASTAPNDRPLEPAPQHTSKSPAAPSPVQRPLPAGTASGSGFNVLDQRN